MRRLGGVYGLGAIAAAFVAGLTVLFTIFGLNIKYDSGSGCLMHPPYEWRWSFPSWSGGCRNGWASGLGIMREHEAGPNGNDGAYFAGVVMDGHIVKGMTVVGNVERLGYFDGDSLVPMRPVAPRNVWVTGVPGPELMGFSYRLQAIASDAEEAARSAMDADPVEALRRMRETPLY